MPFNSNLWGFITPRGKILFPLDGDGHHSDLAKRIVSQYGYSRSYSAKEELIRRNYIAFDVGEDGQTQLIGLQDSSWFRNRAIKFLKEFPHDASSYVEWWFDRCGHAGEAATPSKAVEMLSEPVTRK